MYALLKKLLFTLDPETAHVLAKNATRFAPSSLVARATRVRHSSLNCQIGETPLSNPIGLAAGFDKNGEMLNFLGAIGFGFLELGSVTALPSTGNPQPRIFRLPQDNCLINRMGLPNWGAEVFRKHMQSRRVRVPFGINIAKTPTLNGVKVPHGVDDFLTSYEKLQHLGCYVTLNLSCPNTHDGTTFEDPKLLSELLSVLSASRKSNKDKRPLLIKLSPVITSATLHKIIDTALKYDVDGFVLTNTTPLRQGLKTTAAKVDKMGLGGLSGAPLLESSNKILRAVYEIIGKDKLLIGVGGILSFADLLEKFACGAQLVQIYTGFIYQGPFFVRDLNRKLARHCDQLGVKNYRELVGQS